MGMYVFRFVLNLGSRRDRDIFIFKQRKPMLVLTRKPGDGIVIGDDIIIRIIEMKSGGIRIGIEAPRDKKIYRQEVYDRISRQNRDALQWDMTDLDSLSENLTAGDKQK